MRATLDSLLSQTIGLKYSLPNSSTSIPSITISTLPDDCFQILTEDAELAKVIYHGIVDYSFDENDIDLTKLQTFQQRALIQKLKFNTADTSEAQLKYGLYGEILLYLILQKFYHTGTFISRGYLYNPLNKSETTEYDTYQMLQKTDNTTELWFGEVKFHKDYRTGITQILDKIGTSLSDNYFNTNLIAIEQYHSYINTSVNVSPILEAFRENPCINLAEIAKDYGLSFVYPMLVIFNDNDKSHEDVIKEVVEYTNTKYSAININFSLNYSLFFILLPVKAAKEIKEQVRQWILSNQPVI